MREHNCRYVHSDDQENLEVPDESGRNQVAIRFVIDRSKEIQGAAAEWIGGLVNKQLTIDRQVTEVVCKQVAECNWYQRRDQARHHIDQRLIKPTNRSNGRRETCEEQPDGNDHGNENHDEE